VPSSGRRLTPSCRARRGIRGVPKILTGCQLTDLRADINWIVRVLAFAWLILITFLSAGASFKGLVPLDARTGLQIANLDAAFEQSIIGSAIEPFSSLAHVIVGAPDYRIAAISVGGWLFVFTFSIYFWLTGFKKNKQTPQIRALKSLRAAVKSILIFALYGFFVIIVPLPDRSLVVRDPTVIAADLHSHTFLSGDGIASSDQSFAYHRARGYNVVAFTEHYSDVWRSSNFVSGQDQHQPLDLIRGVELSIRNFGEEKFFIVALGIQPKANFPYPLRDQNGTTADEASRQLVDFIHNVEHGAVVVVSYLLHPKDIERLAKMGVDGFELANFGHPRMTKDVRDALLKIQQSYRVALLADSDWHGWSGFARTWSLIKPANLSGGRSDHVVSALRDRDPERIIPVVSQMMGSPSVMRGVFTPFVEIIRYCGEMSLLQVLSWWIWTVIFFGIGALLRRGGLHPARCFMAGVLVVLGGGLLSSGLGLVTAWHAGTPFPFPGKIGAASGSVGIIALIIAGLIVWQIAQSHASAQTKSR
jgi:hypothetical protein